MKISELVRNVTALIAINTFSFAMFAGFICDMLTTKENMISLAITLVVGFISYLMHKISE